MLLLPMMTRALALSAGGARASVGCCAGMQSQLTGDSPFSRLVTLEDLRREQADFVAEREWAKFHTPRSLALALVGEVGELCETLQWKGDECAQPGLPGWSEEERVAFEDELADVLSYVIRLADVAKVDLPAAAYAKIAKNRAKYPAELVKGSAAKYSEYRKGEDLLLKSPMSVDEQAQSGLGGAALEDDGMGEWEVREWGQPQWVVDAYARAEARVAAKLSRQASGRVADALEVARGDGASEEESSEEADNASNEVPLDGARDRPSEPTAATDLSQAVAVGARPVGPGAMYGREPPVADNASAAVRARAARRAAKRWTECQRKVQEEPPLEDGLNGVS